MEEVEGGTLNPTHRRTKADQTTVVTEIADVVNAQEATEPAHPIEAIAALMNEVPAMDHLAKNADRSANVAAVVKSAAASETAVVDATVASAKEEATDLLANQEEPVNLVNLVNPATVVAADVNVVLVTTVGDHATIVAVEVEEAQTTDARGDEIRRTRGKNMEMRRGGVKARLCYDHSKEEKENYIS